MHPDDGVGEKPTRLQAFLSRAGIASRRKCELLIAGGHVAVNGKIVTEMGSCVARGDSVAVDGRPVIQPERRAYLAMNKPSGCLCSASDPEGRPLIFDYVGERYRSRRLFTVGRLDMYSSGLILLTDDGDFAAALGHPSCGIEKEYRVEATVPVPDGLLEAFLSGVTVEGEVYKASRVRRESGTIVHVTLVEGKNREIRNVFAAFAVPILALSRVRIGPLELGELKPGETRELSEAETRALRAGRGRGER